MSIANLRNTAFLSALSPTSPTSATYDPSVATIPFTHQPTYISLTRMLTRYQHILLLQPPSSSLTPLQQQIQAELHSPLPFHRTKWLHNIEHARTLLLQLEHAAQNIKFQRQKREAIHDLAEKRVIIKKLRRHVEDVGREVEAMGPTDWATKDGEKKGETVEQLLGRPPLEEATTRKTPNQRSKSSTLGAGKPVSMVEDTSSDEDGQQDNAGTILDGKPYTAESKSNSQLRRRLLGKPSSPSSSPSASGTTTGTSLPKNEDSTASTESHLLAASSLQESLTTSLVSMASQLKQQARNLSATLETDKSLLNRALDGIDRNVAGMAAASSRMAFLRRMSEGQGWFGRLKLYALIFGLWVVAIILVFVGPKFRF